MIQNRESFHWLEMRERIDTDHAWLIWHEPFSSVYEKAKRLARNGRVVEALENAKQAIEKNYNNALETEFRCVTTERIVTFGEGGKTVDRLKLL